MHDNKGPTLQEELTSENLIRKTLSQLIEFCKESDQNCNQDTFMRDIFNPMVQHPCPSGASLHTEFMESQNTDTPLSLKNAAMLISCAYCAQTMQELKKNNRETALLYLAEARYWCGAMTASRGIEEARNKTISATRKNTSIKANQVRNDPFVDIKEVAFRLVMEKCPPEKWPSNTAAAKAVKEDVLAFAKSATPKTLTPTGITKTICRWLNEMPNRQKFFTKHKTV